MNESDWPWNRVVLGDGTQALLIPHGSINVITEEDGHRSCNHTDATACDRPGHETRSLYDVIREGEPGWWDAPEVSDLGAFFSYDVLRSWPEFAAAEHLLTVGTPVTLEVSGFGIRGEFLIDEIGEYGVVFRAPSDCERHQT